MPTDTRLLVRKRKFDGHMKSEWKGEHLPFLAENWLVVLHHPDRHRKVAAGVVQRADLLFLHCFSMTQSLVVLLDYDHHGRFLGAKCDAALPATLAGQVIDFVDLDLDVIVDPDLSSFVRDEETFAHNKERWHYPADVVQQAQLGIAFAQMAVNTRLFPFETRLVPLLDPALWRNGGARDG